MQGKRQGVGTNLYAAGDFSTGGGVAAVRVAKRDGVAWSALGRGVTNLVTAGVTVSAIAAAGNDVYFGGVFELAGLKPSHNFGRWNETIDFEALP